MASIVLQPDRRTWGVRCNEWTSLLFRPWTGWSIPVWTHELASRIDSISGHPLAFMSVLVTSQTSVSASLYQNVITSKLKWLTHYLFKQVNFHLIGIRDSMFTVMSACQLLNLPVQTVFIEGNTAVSHPNDEWNTCNYFYIEETPAWCAKWS